MTRLSKREAYLAMFSFLEQRYDMTKSDELGALLGSMSLLRDGGTADPAIWEDWCQAVLQAQTDDVKADLDLK